MTDITIKIDGKSIKTQKDRFVLDIARENGIEIPAICYDPSLDAFGGCRLCIVEITKNGRSKIETSCSARASDGMEVKTQTEELREKKEEIFCNFY